MVVSLIFSVLWVYIALDMTDMVSSKKKPF